MFEDIYGSDMREKALAAITYYKVGKQTNAFTLIKDLSKMLSSNQWYSTQSLSFALIACSEYFNGQKIRTSLKANLKIDNVAQTIESFKYIKTITIDHGDQKHSFEIKNQSNFPIYIQLIQKAVPPISKEISFEKGLHINLQYQANNSTLLDLNNLYQTTDMYAIIQVSKTTTTYLQHLALTYTIPSGWEILNDHMLATATNESTNMYEYKDIRDDKVMYYFGLAPRQTKTFKIPVNATFAGKFYHPAVFCESMYNNDINAQLKGQWIEVKPAQ